MPRFRIRITKADRHDARKIEVNFRILGTDQQDEWDQLMSRCPHDFYHLASYHRMAEESGEGTARLLVFEDSEALVLAPILLRCVSDVEGLEESQSVDITSVYGYSGPVASQNGMGRIRAKQFLEAVNEYLDSIHGCCAFARLHPLLGQTHILAESGSIRAEGQTVSIDLTATAEQQWAEVRSGHKYDLKRLHKAGFTCFRDADLDHLDEFIALYHGTMKRIGAGDFYRFDRTYFHQLLSLEGANFSLFVCLLDGVVACGGLFSLCDGIVQYHLSGTNEQFSKTAPTKLMLDEVRKWAIVQGARVFHLGGGVGSKRDSLFAFKAGFSKRRHTFNLWTWIRDEEAYRALVARRAAHLGIPEPALTGASYFPAYRAQPADVEIGSGQ
jgi:hypothetical protein